MVINLSLRRCLSIEVAVAVAVARGPSYWPPRPLHLLCLYCVPTPSTPIAELPATVAIPHLHLTISPSHHLSISPFLQLPPARYLLPSSSHSPAISMRQQSKLKAHISCNSKPLMKTQFQPGPRVNCEQTLAHCEGGPCPAFGQKVAHNTLPFGDSLALSLRALQLVLN